MVFYAYLVAAGDWLTVDPNPGCISLSRRSYNKRMLFCVTKSTQVSVFKAMNSSYTVTLDSVFT